MLSNKNQAKEPVFAIVISEKGGAERREVFEQPELNIGRVQGNELMLPKGNVSKRHARLVHRDGRFIVSDLNSTNGTYVNRRRISQATIVRQGDRIYIGDFVLRIEASEDSNGSSSSGPSPSQSVQPIPLREPMMTAPDTGPSGSARSKIPPAPPPPTGYPPVPPAPRMPMAPPPATAAQPSSSNRQEPSVVERLPGREDSIDTEGTAYRSAVAVLVERVSQRLGAATLDREPSDAVVGKVATAIAEQLAELRREDVIGAAIVDERLKRDAQAELVELGAIGPLLEDETVTEIAIAGSGPIVATRAGRRITVEPPLSSESSVRRVLARLLRQAKTPATIEDGIITRRLPNGFRLTALTGARAPSGTLLRLDRAHRVDATLDDLVRAGAVSRAVATFLRHCVAVRANILIVGPKDARPATVAGALASASPDGHVVAIQDTDMIVSTSVPVSHVDVAGAPDDARGLIDFAGRLPGARLVVDNFSGAVAAAALDAVSSGADGLVAVAPAGSLRRALARLPAELVAARPGLGIPAAREWLAGTFDIMIDVARLRDGRQRVIRVAEPASTETGDIVVRDVFAFVVERMVTGGVVEGTFQATGIAPKVVGDMASRGIHIDSGVFSRPPSR